MLVATNPDIFDKTLGLFPVVFLATKTDMYDETSGHFPAVDAINQHIFCETLGHLPAVLPYWLFLTNA